MDVKSKATVTVSARIIRADGTIEDRGVIVQTAEPHNKRVKKKGKGKK